MTFDELYREYTELKSTHEATVSQLQSQIDKLQESLTWFQKQIHGKKSERRVPENDSSQISLFTVPENRNPRQEQTTEVAAHTRTRKKSTAANEEDAPEGTYPEHLRRETIEVDDDIPEDVSEEDLEYVGTKVTERLAEEPGNYYVKRYVRKVYKKKGTDTFYVAPSPEHIFDRCKVDETFIVMLIIKKFLYHMPLYRQFQMLKAYGVEMSRGMLAVWVIRLSELLSPVVMALEREVLEQSYILLDETPQIVGKGGKRKGKKYKQECFWPILHPDIGVSFLYCQTKAYRELKDRLKDYKGSIVSDAARVYEKFVGEFGNNWQLCMMHVRRDFIKAEPNHPELCGEALAYIRRLYEIESEIKEKGYTEAHDIAGYRFVHATPVLDEFKLWLKQKAALPEVITSDNLARAVSYPLKRWDAVVLYLSHGELPLDNGETERKIRPTKLGLKNFLHYGSETGATAGATFYSLIASAMMHDIHPFYYILDITKRIEQPGVSARDLVPHRWKELFYEEAVPKYLQK